MQRLHWAGHEGRLFIAIFNIPKRFYRAGGRDVDFAGDEWNAKWGDVLRRHEEALFA